MRIEIEKLVEIQKVVDCNVEVGADEKDVLTLRFGYWSKLSDSDYAAVKHILGHRDLLLELVDEDDECGELWNYKVEYKW